MKNIKKYIALPIVSFCLMAVSCGDDLPKSEESDKYVELDGIKILNVGLNGDSVVVGEVNQITKLVTFPELDERTVLSDLKFEAKLSSGAKLEMSSNDFSIPKGQFSKTNKFRVSNSPRYKDYLVTVSFIQYGADFKTGKTFDFSKNILGEPIYDDMVGTNTRGADFDGQNILVVSRQGVVRPHVLKMYGTTGIVETKKANYPILLNLSGVSGGIFAVNSGRLAQGHVYISNLSGDVRVAASPLKIYHWANTEEATLKAPPSMTYSFGDDADEKAILETGVTRYGDNMSVSLNSSGDGFIFLGSNTVGNKGNMLRLKVTGFTNITEPTIIPILTVNLAGNFLSFNGVDGVNGEYLFTGGLTAPIKLVDENMNVLHTMSTAEPFKSADNVRIFKYNKERYLAFTKCETVQKLYVYNITPGATTAEALTLFEAGEKVPVFEYSLDGAHNSGVPLAFTGWGASPDGKALNIFTGAPQAGFAVFEFPKK